MPVEQYLRDGCGYRFVVTPNGGGSGVPIADLTRSAVEATWGRRLNATSEATLVLQKTDSGPKYSCCAQLPLIAGHAVEYELQIQRGGRLVWVGSIASIDEGRDQVTIRARDGSVWFRDWRIIRTARQFDAVDIVTQWVTVASDALAVYNPGVLLPGTPTLSGTTGSRTVTPTTAKVASVLDEITRAGVDWCVVGREVFVGSATPADPTANLTDADVLGDLHLNEDGESFATYVVATGDAGLTASASVTGPGGVVKDDIVDQRTATDTGSLAAAASARLGTVGAQGHAPLVLAIPSGSVLAPTTGVTIAQLVPGSTFTVNASGFCRRVAAFVQRLTDLTVNVKGEGEGETVKVTMEPRRTT